MHPNPATERESEALAPGWHTAALIVLMVAVAATGLALGDRGASPEPRSRTMAVYLPLLLVEWSLALYVCRIGRPRNALRALLGRGWDSIGRAAFDLAVAAAGWLVVDASEAAFGRWGTARSAAVLAMLPRTVAEHVVWVIVAVSVGFCEEVVYRGYLQAQLAALAGSTTLAVALQGALFGLAHGEQGLATAARFAVYGAGFGGLARWRRSLVPGIACHIGIDVAAGFLVVR